MRRFLKLSECKHFFFLSFFFEKKIKIFLKQTEFVCVCHVCVCVSYLKIPRRRSFVQVWTRERECD